MRAEVGHGTIKRAGATVQHLRVAFALAKHPPELRHGDGRKNQLALEAEHVQRAGAFLWVGGSKGFPPFEVHQIGFDIERRPMRGVAFFANGVRHAAAGIEVWRQYTCAHMRVGVRNQPVLCFHQVTIGIIENPTFGVWHCVVLLFGSWQKLSSP